MGVFCRITKRVPTSFFEAKYFFWKLASNLLNLSFAIAAFLLELSLRYASPLILNFADYLLLNFFLLAACLLAASCLLACCFLPDVVCLLASNLLASDSPQICCLQLPACCILAGNLLSHISWWEKMMKGSG